MKIIPRFFLLSLASIAIATPAFAHPKLVGATPAANSAGGNVTSIKLAFNEKIMPQMSGFDVTMTAMPGMANHKPMKLKGYTTVVSNDGKTIVAKFPRALPAGTYRIDWHVVGDDTHRMTGTVNFSAL